MKREKRNPSPPTERSPSPTTYKEDLKILREESERAARIREELERTARVEKELQKARTKRCFWIKQEHKDNKYCHFQDLGGENKFEGSRTRGEESKHRGEDQDGG